MKTQLISDTHGKHLEMQINTDVDLIVHAGDSTNYYDLFKNELEFRDFIKWYGNLPIKHKILIAGNHDAWALKKYNRDTCGELGITYLEDDYVEIEGKLIFGSPWSPSFGRWHFNKSRQKLASHWDKVLIEGIDLLVTHTPPKGILDLSENQNRNLEMCGCRGLMGAVEKYKPKNHVFGHIHNNKDITNFGSRVLGETNFFNASSVRDGDFHKAPMNNKGILINI